MNNNSNRNSSNSNDNMNNNSNDNYWLKELDSFVEEERRNDSFFDEREKYEWVVD